jgi:hypothetical protein
MRLAKALALVATAAVHMVQAFLAAPATGTCTAGRISLRKACTTQRRVAGLSYEEFEGYLRARSANIQEITESTSEKDQVCIQCFKFTPCKYVLHWQRDQKL